MFFGLVTSSYLCFLWSEWYFVVFSCKSLWSYPSSIFFSFNHIIPLLSTIISIPFLLYVSLLLSKSCFYSVFHRSFSIFYFYFHFIYFLNTLLIDTNLSWLINKLIKDLEIRTSIISGLAFPNNTSFSFSL